VTGRELLEKVVATAVVVVLFWLAYFIAARAGFRFVERISRRGEPGTRAATLWSLVRRLLLAVVVITAVLTVIAGVWQWPITPFLAVGSAAGVAIGFGAQKLVQDVIAGFLLLLEDQFRIGDGVTLAGISGEVQEIKLRVTVLRDVGGYVHYIPNGDIRVATNMTQGFAQVVLDLSISYDNDLDRAIAILEDELTKFAADGKWSEMFLERPVILGVEKMAETGIVLRALARVRPPDRWAVHREALRRIKSRFDQEGISLPAAPLSFYRTDTAGTNT